MEESNYVFLTGNVYVNKLDNSLHVRLSDLTVKAIRDSGFDVQSCFDDDSGQHYVEMFVYKKGDRS